jgi:hypothetical membrane protein
MSRLQVFAAACWGSAGPALVVPGLVAAARWDAPFSWWRNNISDLGEAGAPWHLYANLSLVLTGALLAVGALGLTRGVARLLLLLGSAGYLMAGFFPADTHEDPHMLGALLIMGAGNLGLLLIARLPGVVAIVGTVGFFALDAPILERVAVFPLLAWAGVSGVELLRRTPCRTPVGG